MVAGLRLSVAVHVGGGGEGGGEGGSEGGEGGEEQAGSQHHPPPTVPTPHWLVAPAPG